MPMQLGPTIFKLPLIAISLISFSSSIPSGVPVSLNPAVYRCTPITFLSAQSLRILGTICAGTETMTRSMGPGTSNREG